MIKQLVRNHRLKEYGRAGRRIRALEYQMRDSVTWPEAVELYSDELNYQRAKREKLRQKLEV